MDEFEFFGVANGQAVVRHRGQGHVFRFAPMTRVGWESLALHGVEAGETTSDDPGPHVPGALHFASRSVVEIMSRPPQSAEPARRRWFLSRAAAQ